MAAIAKEQEPYLADYARFAANGAAAAPAWVQALRAAAIARFAELGFPTTHHEEWKYTNVAPLTATPFTLAGAAAATLTAAAVAPFSLAHIAAAELVFVNGRYAPDLSCAPAVPVGVQAGSLAAALRAAPAALEPFLGRYAGPDDNPFLALNTAFLDDGAYVVVPTTRRVEQPIHLLFLSTAPAGASVSHPRNLIVIGGRSRATIVETYAGLGDDVYFTNAATEIVARDGAIVDHYTLHREADRAFHVATLQMHLDHDSTATSHAVTLGGALVRSNVNARLAGPGSTCTLNGLYLTGGQQHVDHHTRIDHDTPHGTSRELYKGVLDGHSRGVFSGKIHVHPQAQQTDAQQRNQNLLLSADAKIDTKPQLEIYADDVKCTHGATIGQLDPESLFYLRARGIGLADARRLLTYAFASEMLQRIAVEPLRAQLDALLLSRLAGAGDGR